MLHRPKRWPTICASTSPTRCALDRGKACSVRTTWTRGPCCSFAWIGASCARIRRGEWSATGRREPSFAILEAWRSVSGAASRIRPPSRWPTRTTSKPSKGRARYSAAWAGPGAVRILEGLEGRGLRPGETLAGMDPQAERLRRAIRGADAGRGRDHPPRSGLARVGHPSSRGLVETPARKGLALGERKGYIPRAAGVRPFLERETR